MPASNTWAPGIQLLPDFDEATLDRVIHDVQGRTSGDDVVVVSIHYGCGDFLNDYEGIGGHCLALEMT